MNTSRHQVRFLLGRKIIETELDDPTTTLLEYLREQAELKGTKEGCAEGDCGACTVLIGELKDGRLQHTSANACILLLGMVDEKQIITVEHAALPEPHPVQRAMVATDGSQCGFCTPGFVMSMIGLQSAHADNDHDSPPTREAIDQALAGNLCRCTGYGPIIDAARHACALPLSPDWQAMRCEAQATLSAWAKEVRPLASHGKSGRFEAPRTSAALLKALQLHPDATLVAGATDVGLWITKQGRPLSTLIHVGAIDELKTIESNDTGLHIGAAVSLADAAGALGALSLDIERVLLRFGAAQVRNRGTLGGNIANGSPIGDMAPISIALDARLHLSGPEGSRTIPLETFFIAYGQQDLRPGEFLESISIPISDLSGFRCWKISKRFDQDISAVLGAFQLMIDGEQVQSARICFGGMAGTPQRAAACERALTGQCFDRATLALAQTALTSDFSPLSDLRASRHYRLRVASNLLERYWLDCIAGETQPDLYSSSMPGLLQHV